MSMFNNIKEVHKCAFDGQNYTMTRIETKANTVIFFWNLDTKKDDFCFSTKSKTTAYNAYSDLFMKPMRELQYVFPSAI